MEVLSDTLLSGEAAKACPKRARSVHERAAKPQVLTVSLPSPTFSLRARPKPPCYAGYAIYISSVFFIKMNCSGAHFTQSSPSNYKNIYQRQFNFGISESDNWGNSDTPIADLNCAWRSRGLTFWKMWWHINFSSSFEPRSHFIITFEPPLRTTSPQQQWPLKRVPNCQNNLSTTASFFSWLTKN